MWACTLALSQRQNASQTLASCLENACPWSEGQNHTSQSLWMEKNNAQSTCHANGGMHHPLKVHGDHSSVGIRWLVPQLMTTKTRWAAMLFLSVDVSSRVQGPLLRVSFSVGLSVWGYEHALIWDVIKEECIFVCFSSMLFLKVWVWLLFSWIVLFNLIYEALAFRA